MTRSFIFCLLFFVVTQNQLVTAQSWTAYSRDTSVSSFDTSFFDASSFPIPSSQRETTLISHGTDSIFIRWALFPLNMISGNRYYSHLVERSGIPGGNDEYEMYMFVQNPVIDSFQAVFKSKQRKATLVHTQHGLEVGYDYYYSRGFINTLGQFSSVQATTFNNSFLVFPNPLRSSVTIAINQPFTELSIYNILGNNVRTLNTTRLEKREYEFNVSLPAGMYYLRC